LPQLGQVNVTYDSFDSSILCNGHAPAQCKYGRNLLNSRNMGSESYQIHSSARGPHWIAWVSRDGSGKPDGGVVLVAGNKEEAEARAERWARQRDM
jgi:hypothetical protein